MLAEDDESDIVRNRLSSKFVGFFVLFLFVYLLFFITEDRNSVLSPPLQTALIEEVVKKTIVTGGTYISDISYSS